LQLLKDQALDYNKEFFGGGYTGLDDLTAAWNFNSSQAADAIEQMTVMLASLSLQSAIQQPNLSLDQQGGYIGINATRASMDGLDVSIVNIYNVPAFRLSANCTPARLKGGIQGSPNLTVTTLRQYAPQIQGVWNSAIDSRLFTYQYIGAVEDFYPGKRAAYPRVLPLLVFPGIPPAESDVVMSYIYTANMSQYPKIKTQPWINTTL